MPPRQHLLGLWLLLTGVLLFSGVGVLLWLDSALKLAAAQRTTIWLLCLLPGVLALVIGMLLEKRLFRPLRQFQVLLARLVAAPDAQSDFPLDGWLSPLQPDLDQIREGWRGDRERTRIAHDEGAAHAAYIQQELEGLLQILDLPLLICDEHQRLLLFNPAARTLFHDQPALGLGRQVSQLLPHTSLSEALHHLPTDGTPRQLLLPGDTRWLRCELRRLDARHGGALIVLHDTTHELEAGQRWRRALAELLPRLRGHTGSMHSAVEALLQAEDNVELKHRLVQAISEESRNLAQRVGELTRLVESQQLSQSALEDTWSNDLFQALQERLATQSIKLTAIGIPVWIRVDGPALLAMLELLILRLSASLNTHSLDVEVLLGNHRVYLDLIWAGSPVSEQLLNQWRTLPLFDDALSPKVSDVLNQHDADLWSLMRKPEARACLRLPVPSSLRGSAPRSTDAELERPEFHDFSIADLPPPDTVQAGTPLTQLEMIVFDTETTGLNLRGGDRIISIAACRIINGRLLAQDSFDQLVNPQRDIPATSTSIHGLRNEDVANAPPIDIVLPRFNQYVGSGVLVAHNAAFDLLAVRMAGDECGLTFDMPVLDTLLLSRALDPTFEGHGLDALAERFQLIFPPGTRHTALGDARVTAELLLALLPRLRARGVNTLEDALALQLRVELENKR
ncbi:DNA polymerase III subunit epsilon [Marinobacterium zhoushanense]|uniref:DNA-directed DNA polymerase n=1 Tax=Marinobacterium zhoushanense TaxID=1679163 RepID=A0ABQ1KAW2_9GAMM|nr:exonuclease domain-containing protein [Marinobacterium zhoushanense]GGB89393.1 DNA polymerase III subunit epsilon [Marinobacterium zhoushanense]